MFKASQCIFFLHLARCDVMLSFCDGVYPEPYKYHKSKVGVVKMLSIHCGPFVVNSECNCTNNCNKNFQPDLAVSKFISNYLLDVLSVQLYL